MTGFFEIAFNPFMVIADFHPTLELRMFGAVIIHRAFVGANFRRVEFQATHETAGKK